MPLRLQSALGLASLLLLAWLLSERRRSVSWRFAATGVLVQFALALLFLKTPFATTVFGAVNRAVLTLQGASVAGSTFVFGFLGGGPLPYLETRPGASIALAFRFLPLVIVISALATLLTYWRVLPALVKAFASLFGRLLGLGGAAALASVANPFLGMVESSILVRPYIERLTRSEIFIVMCVGLAGIAGTVLVLYATLLAPIVPDAAGHLLVASVLALPIAVVIARIMIPETEPATPGDLALPDVHGSVDAVMLGTRQGLALFLNIVATLLVFVALVHLCDSLLALLPSVGGQALTLERLFAWLFSPIAWLIGVPWSEAPTFASLLGTKTVLNELVAYTSLAGLSPGALSERSRLLATYALCGFANFGSIGILVSGLATMAPKRSAEIAKLGFRSLIGGTLATCATAAVVGIVL
ncbi:MAG TPA: nucleoside transporter C-terminal domain-containing protein [Steroidobacteraceae bacterium]|jgi:CNT family concentrative nucleoside transporter